MTPLDAALVRRKLAVIVRNLTDLATVVELSLDEYVRDRFRQKGTERLLQEAIEAAVDINLHVLRVRAAGVPTDYYESFLRAGELGLIPGELARRLAPAAGLRNRLVHEYDELDAALVLNAVGEALGDLTDYVSKVEAFLVAEGF